jgi:hypothetical protein
MNCQRSTETMKTVIPERIASDICDKVASGDYRPVDAEKGPQTGPEWLALIEDEAVMQESSADTWKEPWLVKQDAEQSKRHADFAKELREVASQLRSEGFEPVKFHWEKP